MKRVFNLIIVDESGSMCVIEKQALMGLNETIETVKKMQGCADFMRLWRNIMPRQFSSWTGFIP